MGAQISLLTSVFEEDISTIISIVPPYIDDKIAFVSPAKVANLLKAKRILLRTANDDENATSLENTDFFQSVQIKNKAHIVFDGNHILPKTYIESIESWLSNDSTIKP